MDVDTLNAVIDKLQAEADHCHYMLRWALDQKDPETREQAANMWSNCLVQANRSVDIVQEMLNNEHAMRFGETA